MKRRFVCSLIVSACACSIACAALKDGAQTPTGTRILDPDILFYSRPYPTISPDGHWIACVSQGFVMVCNIETPRPQRITEVPYSWTWPHLKAPAGVSPSTLAFASVPRGLDRDQYQFMSAQVTNEISGFNWSYDSSGFVFAVSRFDPVRRESAYEVYFGSTDGKARELARSDERLDTRRVSYGMLTRDGRFLVSADTRYASRNYRPLIWDLRSGRPRATCFLYLTPSSTSDRWIGIEKDSRQLVVVDNQFQVIQRYDDFVPDRSWGFRLEWSPNERFVLWRNQIGFDHFSNWEGFRLDLKTGTKREFDGRFMSEQIAFTGRGGEFYRCGQTGARTRGYDTVVGAHLTIVPSDDAAEVDVWRIVVDPKGKIPGALTNRPGDPPVRYDPTTDLFAIGLPRPAGERSGFVWHLMNRTGKSWQIPGADNGEYHSPFELVGFADGGRQLVAHDDKRLFCFPVSSVMNADSEVQQ